LIFEFLSNIKSHSNQNIQQKMCAPLLYHYWLVIG
jgi:hypothetical protein